MQQQQWERMTPAKREQIVALIVFPDQVEIVAGGGAVIPPLEKPWRPHDPHGHPPPRPRRSIPHYTRDLNAAMTVADKVCEAAPPLSGEHGRLYHLLLVCDGGVRWHAEIACGQRFGEADANTAAEAICLAAVRAMGSSNKEVREQ